MFVNMAPLTNEDKFLIKTLRIAKGWSALRIIREYPARNFKKPNLCHLIKRIDDNGEIDRKNGSGGPSHTIYDSDLRIVFCEHGLVGLLGYGRPRSARTAANIRTVGDLICSQEDRPCKQESKRN